mgnify:CR=1 FL=1
MDLPTKTFKALNKSTLTDNSLYNLNVLKILIGYMFLVKASNQAVWVRFSVGSRILFPNLGLERGPLSLVSTIE